MTVLDIPSGWFGTDLPGRPCALTYCFVPIGDLPPIEATLGGGLGWLEDPGRALGWAIGRPEPDRIFDPSSVDRLRRACATEGIGIPPALEILLTTNRRDWIRSPTACYLELPEGPVLLPGTDSYAIRFLNDQQGVLFWYVALDRDGEQGVVVSNDLFDAGEPWLEEADQRESYRCADTVEEFLYRFWLETEIYFRSKEGDPLTPQMRRYVERLRTDEKPGKDKSVGT